MEGAVQGNAGVRDPALVAVVVEQIVVASGKMEAQGKNPVLRGASQVRLFLSRLLRGRIGNFYILAYEEIPASKNIKVVATIGNNQLNG